MPAYPPPAVGDNLVEFTGNVPMWKHILRMLAEWQAGELGGNNSVTQVGKRTGSQVIIKNDSTSTIPAGTIVQLGSLVDYGTTVTDVGEEMTRRSPIWGVTTAVWHTAIDKLCLLEQPLPPDTTTVARRRRLYVMPIIQVKSGDSYAMPDPSNMTRLRSADAGVYKILGTYSIDSNAVQYAVLDTYESQTLWRVELTQDHQAAPLTTTCKLLRLDGDEFSTGDTIEMSDPDDLFDTLVTGDKGWVIHVANKFYAIQAPC